MFFSKQVDRRSRASMVSFLSSHFRYHTMNSNNRVSSFAHNVKVHKLGLPHNLVNAAYEMVLGDDQDWDFSHIIADFTEKHHGTYTIGTNGRSGGYLVLYNSSYKQSEHKSRCRACGQRNFKKVEETGNNKCGQCGAEGERGRHNYTVVPVELQIHPGQGIDDYEEYNPEQWSMSALRQRVDLVRSFDDACDLIRQSLIDEIEDLASEPASGCSQRDESAGQSASS